MILIRCYYLASKIPYINTLFNDFHYMLIQDLEIFQVGEDANFKLFYLFIFQIFEFSNFSDVFTRGFVVTSTQNH